MNTKIFPPSTLIETNRLILRKPRIEDADLVLNALANEEPIRHLLGLTKASDLVEICTVLLRSITAWNNGERHDYAIVSKRSGLLIGFIRMGGTEKGIFGPALSEEYRGMGLASEAVSALTHQIVPSQPLRNTGVLHSGDHDNADFRNRLSNRFERTIRYRLQNRRARTPKCWAI